MISRRRNKKGGEIIDDNDNKIIEYLNSIFINNPVKLYNTNFFIVVSNTVPKCVVSNNNNKVQNNILQNVEILNKIKEPISIMKCQKELGSVKWVILLLRGETPIGSFCFKTETTSICEAQDDMINGVYNSIIQKVNTTTNGNGFI